MSAPHKLPDTVNWYVACDLAIGEKQTNDYTCLTPFAVDHLENLYFADPVHERLNGFEIVERLLDLVKVRHALMVGIETGHISKALGPQLKTRMAERRAFVSLWEYTPTKDKQARARSFQARLQQGKVFFEQTPWFRDVGRPQLLAFPAGKHDDYVDTLALAALMMEAVIGPAATPLPSAPEPVSIPGTYEWLQARSAKPAAGRGHAPQSLFSHLKKKNKT